MKLLNEDRLKRWYQPDSWVYKNFHYLYENPLWTKTMPTGISVCPYFWKALYARCILRPVVERVVMPTKEKLRSRGPSLESRWLELFIKIARKNEDLIRRVKFRLGIDRSTAKFIIRKLAIRYFHSLSKELAKLDLKRDWIDSFMNEAQLLQKYRWADLDDLLRTLGRRIEHHLPEEEPYFQLQRFSIDDFMADCDLMLIEPETAGKVSSSKRKQERRTKNRSTMKNVLNTVDSASTTCLQQIKKTGNRVGTFFTYVGVLIKAKKNKVCPYFTFTHENREASSGKHELQDQERR